MQSERVFKLLYKFCVSEYNNEAIEFYLIVNNAVPGWMTSKLAVDTSDMQALFDNYVRAGDGGANYDKSGRPTEISQEINIGSQERARLTAIFESYDASSPPPLSEFSAAASHAISKWITDSLHRFTNGPFLERHIIRDSSLVRLINPNADMTYDGTPTA